MILDSLFKKLIIALIDCYNYSCVILSYLMSKLRGNKRRRGGRGKGGKGKVEQIIPEEKEEEVNLYVNLEDGNEFPPWFNMGKDSLVLPFSKRKDNTYRFYYDEKYVGQNDIYRFYLSEIWVSQTVNHKGIFMIMLDIKTKIKKSKIREYPVHLKQIKPTYEILCPIWQ